MTSDREVGIAVAGERGAWPPDLLADRAEGEAAKRSENAKVANRVCEFAKKRKREAVSRAVLTHGAP
jgi:hypothetical protein